MTEELCTSVRVVSKPDSYKLQRHKAPDGNVWYMGCVRTPHGFVAVYSDERVAMLQIIVDSREYEARIDRGDLSARYLVTLANRFAQEVAA
jgi:hypothetical protein